MRYVVGSYLFDNDHIVVGVGDCCIDVTTTVVAGGSLSCVLFPNVLLSSDMIPQSTPFW